MAFVQIIDYRTSKSDEMDRVGKEWEAAVGDDSKARRRVLGQRQYNPNRYLNIVFFDSHDAAMENSDNPVTQEYSHEDDGVGRR